MQLSGLMSMDGSYFLSCSSNVLSFHNLGWMYLDWLPRLHGIHGWHSWPMVDTAGHLPQLCITSSHPEVPCTLANISPTSVYIYYYQVCKMCSIESGSIDLHFAVCIDTSWRDTRWRPTSSSVIRVLIPWHRCALKASCMLRCRGGTSQNFAYFKNNSWTKVVPR